MQGPDTDAQDQPPPFFHIRLATHGRSIQLGQTRKSGDAITTSALPPTADIPESGCDVRKVPGTDSCAATNSGIKTRCQSCSSLSNALASFRSSVIKPSVN